MSATTATDTLPQGDRALALSLGLVSRTPPAVRLPSLVQQRVPGASPLEASGWSEKVDAARAVARV